MLAASLVTLGGRAWQMNMSQAVVGLFLGAVFLAVLEFWHHQQEDSGSSLIFAAMFAHSIPEGVAIGVGFATGDLAFGVFIALAIAVHNIPEGTAISLPLYARGASLGRCFWVSVASSLPQPLFAVPALLFTATFVQWQPIGLGFAAGAMIYLAFSELIPEAVNEGGRRLAATGVCVGLVLMTGLNFMLEWSL